MNYNYSIPNVDLGEISEMRKQVSATLSQHLDAFHISHGPSTLATVTISDGKDKMDSINSYKEGEDDIFGNFGKLLTMVGQAVSTGGLLDSFLEGGTSLEPLKDMWRGSESVNLVGFSSNDVDSQLKTYPLSSLKGLLPGYGEITISVSIHIKCSKDAGPMDIDMLMSNWISGGSYGSQVVEGILSNASQAGISIKDPSFLAKLQDSVGRTVATTPDLALLGLLTVM